MSTVKSLLNRLCGSAADSRAEIEKELENYFIDPFYVANSDYLPDSDPLKHEARIVSDAFEAVTNGMYDEGVISALENVSDNSIFTGWRYLTEAVYHIYEKNSKAALLAAGKIAPEAIPSLLKPVISAILSEKCLADINCEENFSEAELSLIRDITKENIKVRDNINRALVYLGNRNEEDFIDTATLIITDLFSHSRASAEKAAVWALKQLFMTEMSHELFMENITLIFGEPVSFRICALALMEEDPELSTVFWLKTAVSETKRNGADRETIEAYLEIIRDLLPLLKHGDSDSAGDEDFFVARQIRALSEILEKELAAAFPGLAEAFFSGHSAEQVFSADFSADAVIARQAEPVRQEKTAKQTGPAGQAAPGKEKKAAGRKKAEKGPVQLELFA